MSILVIGGDRLGNIPEMLQKNGFSYVQHYSGRKKQSVEEIVASFDYILVLTDFVGTDLARRIKTEAKKKKVSFTFSKRSWSYIYKALQDAGTL